MRAAVLPVPAALPLLPAGLKLREPGTLRMPQAVGQVILA